jgi:hypothetical protein
LNGQIKKYKIKKKKPPANLLDRKTFIQSELMRLLEEEELY